jgi:hypothetical protein
MSDLLHVIRLAPPLWVGVASWPSKLAWLESKLTEQMKHSALHDGWPKQIRISHCSIGKSGKAEEAERTEEQKYHQRILRNFCPNERRKESILYVVLNNVLKLQNSIAHISIDFIIYTNKRPLLPTGICNKVNLHPRIYRYSRDGLSLGN